MSYRPSPFPVNFSSQYNLGPDVTSFLTLQAPALCEHCEGEFWPFALQTVQSSGTCAAVQLCEDCRSVALPECGRCGQEMYRAPGDSGTEHDFCRACHDSPQIVRCADCADYCELDSSYVDSNDNFLCRACRRRSDMCESCGTWTRRTDIFDGGYCESCRLDEEYDDDDDSSGAIRSYHSGPENGWRKRTLPGECRKVRTFGIEIEMERGSCSSTLASAAEDVQGYGRGLFHCESDGSLSDGFESISQPCSLNYWAAALRAGGDARAMLDNARRSGLRSHDTTTCGLHVHIDRDSLSRCTTYKLIAFLDANPRYVLHVSRRKNMPSLEEWAAPAIGKTARLGSAAGLAKKFSPESGLARYSAANVCRRTVEIRIFRGSLIAATVLGAIQWCDALATWCENSTLAAVSGPDSWQEFCRYAAASPAARNWAEMAQSELYCRQFSARPRLARSAA